MGAHVYNSRLLDTLANELIPIDALNNLVSALRIIERIERQVALIEDLVNELRVETSYRGVERLVQVIIQALLDLGLMAISALRGRRPSRYSEIGFVLYELGVLNREQAEMLRAMAGLRNILVHMYAQVDREKVLEFSRRLVGDAIGISNAILNNLKNRVVDPSMSNSVPELENTISILRKVLEGRVKLAYLFGGRVKGYVLKGDYDIAVLMPENYTLYDLGLLQVEIAKALSIDEDEIDLVCLNNAPPQLVLEALEGIPIIEDPLTRFELEVKALREVLDLGESLRFANCIQ